MQLDFAGAGHALLLLTQLPVWSGSTHLGQGTGKKFLQKLLITLGVSFLGLCLLHW